MSWCILNKAQKKIWNIMRKTYKMRTTYKKQFLKFLKDNDAYYNFIQELKASDTVSKFMNTSDLTKYSFLSGMFYWGTSKKGLDYWSKLSCKWCEILNRQKC